MFATPDPLRYVPEAVRPDAERSRAPNVRDDDAPDAARVAVAVEHLDLLVRQAGERLERGGAAEAVRDDVELAREVGGALVHGRSIPRTRDTAFAAELMIIADGSRPASLVRGGRLFSPRQLGSFGDMFERFLPDALRSVAATGRLDRHGRHVGTAVLAQHPSSREPILLTAGHVLGDPGSVADGAVAEALTVDFLGEVGVVGSARHRLGRLLAVGDAADWRSDYAVFELGTPVDGVPPPEPIRIDGDRRTVEPPSQLAVVSYPGVPQGAARAMWPEGAWSRVFEGMWHLKRVSPAWSIRPVEARLVRHDATTTGGSSGGAMLSIGTGRLAGLHLGGEDGVNVALRAVVPLSMVP